MDPTSTADPSPRHAVPRHEVDRPVALRIGRLLVLGAASGVLAGLASYAFLTALDHATDLRLDHGWIVWLLPVAGLVVGLAYHRIGGAAAGGNGLLIDEIHEPTAWVPRRMAPLVAVGTVVSHLFGASVGREGTALQMSGSLTDLLSRTLGLDRRERRLLLVAALGGGFGAVFGVPWAGTVFALEVQTVRWRFRRRAELVGAAWMLVPTAAAAVVGDRVVRALGHDHPARPQVHVDLSPTLVGRVALAGVAFGLAAVTFVVATEGVRAGARRWVSWPPLRPALGGLAVLAGVALVGRDQLGLSLPLLTDALAGDRTSLAVPLLKLAFTAVCLGSGFVGGEVTPLFVIGTTLGAALAPALGVPVVLGAAVGFVAVFGAAANTPVACVVMGVELFGAEAVAPLAVACLVAHLCSGPRSIYATQR